MDALAYFFRNSLESSNSIIEENEGEESERFTKFVGSRNAYIPFSSPTRDSNPGQSTRLYLMTSVSGDFLVNEIPCPFLSKDVPSLMPFNQSELYSVDQPGKRPFINDVTQRGGGRVNDNGTQEQKQ